mgnify:CR=1 FL=1
MVISGASADQIRRWGERLPRSLPIRLRKVPDPRSGDFERFVQEFARCAGNVRIIMDEGGPGELPAIVVSDSLIYQALPYDRELAPFLEFLTNSLGEIDPPAFDLKEKLGRIDWPADITIFIAPGCPHCPEAVKQIGLLAFHQPWIRITIVDAALFPEISAPLAIRAVPTILLDGQFRWTGSVELTELLDTLIHRDSARLPASSLKTLLKDGQAERLAQMMIERGEIFPALADLLTHPEWSVRLGAVVVAEEIIEKSPELAIALPPPLWAKFYGADETVKGDILYLIGLAGSPREWSERFEEIVRSDLAEDLRETAREALDRWNSGREA